MQKTILTIVMLGCSAVLFSHLIGSCNKPDDGIEDELAQVIPDGFPAPAYNFSDNPLTKAGFELGRRLFYDGRLSVDGMHPCSSCHQQIAAFGTYEHDRSHGVNNSHTLRNAPVLFNLAWSSSFHWDGEFNSLKEEAAQPITGHIEMGETFASVIRRIENDPKYKILFRKAFLTEEITPERMLRALAQFTGYMTSANSKYDRYKKGEASFTTQEENGYQLFKTHCVSCHPEPMFTDYSYRNIGLPVESFLSDYGRMRVTGLKEDSLKFKVPTLRNVYISSNYMHDGRFNTLAQCINHYRAGVQQSATLDPLLTNGILLTNTQATEIAVFLRTLTDSSFIQDLRFGPPD